MNDTRNLNWEQVPSGLEAVSTVLQECNEPSIHRDLTLSLYFMKAITDIYGYFVTHKNSLPSLNPGWRRWLENLQLPESADFNVLHRSRQEPGNGERIDLAFNALVEANFTQLKGICSVISFSSPTLGTENRRDEFLQTLLEAIAKLNVERGLTYQGGLSFPSNGFSYLLRYFAALYGKKTGDIIPPEEVTKLLAKLLDPIFGEEICDSACFSGSMLIEYKHTDLNLPQFRLYGQEGNPSAWALAKMNLFLNGCNCSNIELGNTIIDPKLKDGPDKLKQFDVLVSNLLTIPEDWGAEKAEADPLKRFAWGVPLKNKGEYGYIQHMIACLKPGIGRMAVIVPRGVLFRSGAEAKIRQKLIKENLLTAVICLPEKIFYGAIIPVAVMILDARKTEKRKVLFIDASRDFQSGKPRNSLRDSDIDRVFSTYQTKSEVKGYSHLASVEEIENNEYNLNMPRYVQMAVDDIKIDPKQIKSERKKLWEELVRLEHEIEQLIS